MFGLSGFLRHGSSAARTILFVMADPFGGVFHYTKTGTGTLTLSGANSYTGLTKVNEGTLTLSGTIASTKLEIASGATFKYDSTAAVIWEVNPTGSGTFWLAGGAGGVGRINSGSMKSGGGIDFVVDGILAANGHNRDLVFGSLSGASTGTIGEGGGNTGRDLTVGALNKDTTYAGAITADITLTKVGTGTQILSGANTYTGTTTVTGGVLAVTGSIATSLQRNITFTGSGTVQSTTGLLTLGASPVLTGTTFNIVTSALAAGATNKVVSSWTGTATGTPALEVDGVSATFGVPVVVGARTITAVFTSTSGITITTT